MNGIIHNCSHPNDDDASFRISEEDIFLAIFSYIAHLFSVIKPQKLFFLAIDGVAPRAKMNQQRSRRFRTAKENKETIEKAKRRGEEIPEEAGFDSNCITPGVSSRFSYGSATRGAVEALAFLPAGCVLTSSPPAGTPFMARLSQQLKYFIAKKVSEDADWRNVEIVLSGHEVRRPLFSLPRVGLCRRARRSSRDGSSSYRSRVRASTRSWSTSASTRRSRATAPTCATACTAWTPTSSCSAF